LLENLKTYDVSKTKKDCAERARKKLEKIIKDNACDGEDL
jgi:hypothetical protein